MCWTGEITLTKLLCGFKHISDLKVFAQGMYRVALCPHKVCVKSFFRDEALLFANVFFRVLHRDTVLPQGWSPSELVLLHWMLELELFRSGNCIPSS